MDVIFSQSFSYAKNHNVKRQRRPHAASLVCRVTERNRPQENILSMEKMTSFNLHFICFTFYSKYKAQTLASVPLEKAPQGRNISLDKHLEEEAWQHASPQKNFSQSFQCVQPASSLLLVHAFESRASCFPRGLASQFFVRNQPQIKTTSFFFCFPIIAKINPSTSTVLPHWAGCLLGLITVERV